MFRFKAPNRYVALTLAIGVSFTAYRLITLAIQQPGFFFDEAYYYGWSLTPDWGYYSKPPMVAWLIWLTTYVFGVSEFTTKLGAPLLYLATAYIIQYSTQYLSNAKAGFWAFSLFIAAPFVTLNSWFVTTDAPLLFFWSLTTLFFIRANKNDHWSDWFLAGAFGGLGLLSKYTMILFPVSIVCFFIFTGNVQKLSKPKFWLTITTALAVFAPNIIWQFLNGFPSFIHTVELANKPGWDGNPHEFLLGQLAVFGPIAFTMFLLTFRSKYRNQYPAIWFISWVPLVILGIKSIQGEAFVNWAAFIYPTASILTGIAIAEAQRNVKILHWLISILVAMAFYHYPAIQNVFKIEPTTRNTPYARVDGWREVTNRVVTIASQTPNAFVASNSRTINAYLSFYLPNSIERLRTLNEDGHVSNHYELFYLLTEQERPVIWVNERPLSNTPITGANYRLIEEIEYQVYPSYSKTLWVYYVE